jgi:hypothetical protein
MSTFSSASFRPSSTLNSDLTSGDQPRPTCSWCGDPLPLTDDAPVHCSEECALSDGGYEL